jgi:AcrR family transcriptional regulator
MLSAMETTRLTREARRAQTRERLLDAAADVFNRLGFHGASLEAVAEAAGYTKGAVYSNFASKAELFTALAERKGLAANLEAAKASMRGLAIGELVDGMVAGLRSQVERDEAWDILTIEVWLAAMRDPELRPQIARDYREMRAEYGTEVERKLAAEGIRSTFSATELGALISALGSGLILQYYLEPGAIDAGLLGRALRCLLGMEPAAEGADAAR